VPERLRPDFSHVGARKAPTGISMKRLTTAQRCAVDPHPGGRGAQSCAPVPTKRRVYTQAAPYGGHERSASRWARRTIVCAGSHQAESLYSSGAIRRPREIRIQVGAAHNRVRRFPPSGEFILKRRHTAATRDPHPGGRGAQSCAPVPTKRRVYTQAAPYGGHERASQRRRRRHRGRHVRPRWGQPARRASG